AESTTGSPLPAPAFGVPPLSDPPGPAHLDPAVSATAALLPTGATLDLVMSLERPAGARLRGLLAGLGVWSRTFEHIPAAAVRLPVERLDTLAQADGILGVYLNEPLRYYLEQSAQLVNTRRAWTDLGVTGEGVTVAILDTGIDFSHPDLAPAMRANVKLAGFGDQTPVIAVESLSNSDTSSGHGTHVAGDVAARGTASGGAYRGLAPGAGLVGIGAGDGLNMFFVLEGLDWTVANRDRYGIRVINNSWGSQFEPFDPYDPVNGATRVLAEAGVVVVFANGNDGTEMSMNPYAAAPWVLAVAAGDKKGKVASFSSGGIEADTVGLGFALVDVAGETRRPLAMGLYHPAVTTTGEDIVSTRANATIVPLTALPNDLRGIPPENLPYYTTLSGTSMAAPETAGVVALVLEAAPELNPLQVRMVLQVTARPIPDTPFHVGGYGYTDASAAVELALALHGRGARAIQEELDRLQSERDQVVLAGLAHPDRTWAWNDLAPTLVGSRSHQVTVPAGTARLKVVTNGGAVPFIGGASYEITVTDGAGQPVGSAAASNPSGATVLDVDLAKVPGVAFGNWTVEIFAVGSPGTPSTGADDLAAKRLLNVLVSAFGPQPGLCDASSRFVPGGLLESRFQQDGATGVPHPAHPGYTHVGLIRSGSLGQRSPERRLAAAFGLASTLVTPPRFVSEPLAAPVTVGGPAAVRVWVQGPSEAVQGLISGQLLDVAPDGKEETVIGEIPAKVKLGASSAEPVLTEAPVELTKPVTVPAGHRIALTLAVSFIGTSAHTLYFDSDEYPSGLRLTTGRLEDPPACRAAPVPD
ncbi:MAG: S8 family serine peptidase, partial [Actinomycetota bacterium]|nr:S8 family serine peptidase [Actinomycetota bacterium]